MADVVVVGSYVQDLCFQTDIFPAPGETRIGRFRTGPGGKGFNQAVACHRQNVNTLFVGAIGDDVFGREIVRFADSERLETAFQIVAGAQTGAAAIVVNERGENEIVVSLGANEKLDPGHVETVRERIAEAQVVLCQAECNLRAVERTLEIAREKYLLSVLNPAPINPEVNLSLVQRADIVIPNETEFSFLIDYLFHERISRAVWQDDRALSQLADRFGVPTVVITLGKEGCFVAHNGEYGDSTRRSYREKESALFYRVPAMEAETVDTTGAGDAFCGGLVAGLVRFPGEFSKAVRLATMVAALSTESVGTTPAMPSCVDIDRKM